ncbi:MAG: hypothetical protein ABH817_01935 [archaeon]
MGKVKNALTDLTRKAWQAYQRVEIGYRGVVANTVVGGTGELVGKLADPKVYGEEVKGLEHIAQKTGEVGEGISNAAMWAPILIGDTMYFLAHDLLFPVLKSRGGKTQEVVKKIDQVTGAVVVGIHAIPAVYNIAKIIGEVREGDFLQAAPYAIGLGLLTPLVVGGVKRLINASI